MKLTMLMTVLKHIINIPSCSENLMISLNNVTNKSVNGLNSTNTQKIQIFELIYSPIFEFRNAEFLCNTTISIFGICFDCLLFLEMYDLGIYICSTLFVRFVFLIINA